MLGFVKHQATLTVDLDSGSAPDMELLFSYKSIFQYQIGVTHRRSHKTLQYS